MAGFQCKLDGGSFASSHSPHAYTGLAQGLHTFHVRAVDAAGNAGPAASRSWTVDTVAPAHRVDGQAAGSDTTATSTFNWTETSTDVVAFQCWVENGSFQATVPSVGEANQPCASPLTFDVATTNNGQHQFAVRAVDAAGNVSGSGVVPVEGRQGLGSGLHDQRQPQQPVVPGHHGAADQRRLQQPQSVHRPRRHPRLELDGRDHLDHRAEHHAVTAL